MPDVMVRPPVPRPAPPGSHWEPVALEPRWLLLTYPGQCHCGQPSVISERPSMEAMIHRRQMSRHLCADHLGGRWAEDLRIYSWQLVEDEA